MECSSSDGQLNCHSHKLLSTYSYTQRQEQLLILSREVFAYACRPSQLLRIQKVSSGCGPNPKQVLYTAFFKAQGTLWGRREEGFKS